MSNAKCPKCGGASYRLITPAYVECITENLVGVTRIYGPETSVYQACLHRYQISGAATVQHGSCDCGLFAIGLCANCRSSLCGNHGQLAGSKFLCATCMHAYKQERLLEQRKAEETRKKSARIANEAEVRRYERATPGFPRGTCNGADLARALRSLVPGMLSEYVVKTFMGLNVETKRGWGIVWHGIVEGYRGDYRKYYGIIIFEDGCTLGNPPIKDGSVCRNLTNSFEYRKSRQHKTRWLGTPDGMILPNTVTEIRNQILRWRE